MGLIQPAKLGYLWRNRLCMADVCYSRKRTFKLLEIAGNYGPLSAEAV